MTSRGRQLGSRWTDGLGLLLLLSLTLWGCGKSDSNPTDAGPPTGDGPTSTSATGGGGGGTSGGGRQLVFVSAVDVNTLDPQKMSWNHDIRSAGCLYEALVKFKLPELTLEPGVAERWELSDDRLTYTFHLRGDAKWSNGDAVTAEDFIFAWRRALLPDFAADYSQLFYCIAGAEDFLRWRQQRLAAGQRDALDAVYAHFAQTVGLSAPDARTLIVQLKQPTPYFLELCAFATFYPNHAASTAAALTVNPDTGLAQLPPRFWSDPEHLLSNGPYVLSGYRFKRDLTFTPNPHYWDRSRVANAGIVQRIIDRPETALQVYERGEADWLPDIPTAAPIAAQLVQSGRSDVHLTPWAGTYFFSLNCEPKLVDGSPNPLADVRVRRALSMTIDRAALVRQVTRLNQPQALSFIPPDMIPGYTAPTGAGVAFDPPAAKKLLADAGYADGSKLAGLSILYNTAGGHESIAQAIQHMWRQHLGVVVTLEGLEVRSFRQRLKEQKYTIARASWIGDYRDPTTFLDKYHSQGGNNDSKYRSAEYDALLAQATATADPAARLQVLQQAEARLLTDQPIAPIFHYITLHVFDAAKVRHLQPNAWNFRRLELVEVKP